MRKKENKKAVICLYMVLLELIKLTAKLLVSELDCENYKISLVNEMLIQMEKYNGISFATTNLSKSLDSADLRRFDMNNSLAT